MHTYVVHGPSGRWITVGQDGLIRYGSRAPYRGYDFIKMSTFPPVGRPPKDSWPARIKWADLEAVHKCASSFKESRQHKHRCCQLLMQLNENEDVTQMAE